MVRFPSYVVRIPSYVEAAKIGASKASNPDNPADRRTQQDTDQSVCLWGEPYKEGGFLQETSSVFCGLVLFLVPVCKH